MKKISLNGKWNMYLNATGTNFSVNVPCSDYGAMLSCGAIDDPFYMDNEEKCLFIVDSDKTFDCTFTLDKQDLNHKNITLSCKMLDTLCDVYVNDIVVGKGENTYIEYNFDISQVVKAGENSVKIIFHSPVNYVKERQKQKALPRNCNGIDGVPYIRKPACHFGWDWGINLPLSGIMGDIDVVMFDEYISYFDVTQTHHNGVVTIDVVAVGNGTVAGEIIAPNGEEIKLNFNGNRATAVIENPQLWWTYELSGTDTQPLYTVRVNDVVKKIGLRTISLNRKQDEYGNNFQFVLNGVPIFAKGANMIPPDAIADRINFKTYETLVNDARLANFNMIRVWGGGYYGSDDFYNLCDEKGILVWQDFMFACLMYPFYEEDFLNNVKREVEWNVKRIKHHCSLALWCGNNEIEFMFAHLPESSQIVQWYKKFFYELLPEYIREFDSTTPYIETSPIGQGFRKNITADNWGDTHMWHVWHGSKNLKYYRKRNTRFCSEYGMESLPSMDCIRQFAPEGEFDLYSKTMLHHQKCLSGNSKMFFYLLERYNKPDSFDDLIYFTGLTQMECIRDATEHWRRNKGRCNGSLWWQYNDCWGAPSWSSVDWFGKWKPLMYGSREFNQPFTLSFEDRKNEVLVYLLNDTLQPKECVVECGVYRLDGSRIKSENISVAIGANSVKNVLTMSVKNVAKNNCYVLSRLICDGVVVVERTKVLLPERKLKLKNANIECKIDGNKIILKSDTFARQVFVDIKGQKAPLSENGFDLLPNEEKVIELSNGDSIIGSDVTVKCVNNVKCTYSNLQRFAFRLKFSLNPVNIANRVYYSVS